MKWFQHQTDANRNSKLRKVVRVHGMLGCGIWWTLLERLYEAEGDFQIKASELWLEDFADDCKITDPRTLTRVFDTFAEVGLISRQLWAEHVIYCEGIQERGDDYIHKKTQNAKRQARFRDKAKADKEKESPVSNALRNAKSNDVTSSDLEIKFRDQIQRSNSEIREKDPETRDRGNPNLSSLSSPTGAIFDQENEPEQIAIEVEVVQDQNYETIPDGNDPNSQRQSIGLDQKVPLRREVNVAALTINPPVDTLAQQFGIRSSSDSDYLRFKRIYEGLCFMVDGIFGTHAKVQQAWQSISDQGEIDDNFWAGLDAYIAQKRQQFTKEGKAIGVKGAANWLLDREWLTALAREEMVAAAQKQGIDLDSSKSVKAAAVQANNMAVVERVRQKLEKKNA